MMDAQQIDERHRMREAALRETFAATGVSLSDYLTQFSGRRAEWVYGNILISMPNNKKHQDIFTFLLTLFNLYLGLKPIGTVLAAAFSMVIGEDHPAREPDVMIVLNAHRARIQLTYLDWPADIAVEIVSPESSERDRGVKFHEYEAVGVQEYGLIDPLRQEAIVYTLGADGRYHRAALDADGRLISALLPGFALDPDLFWKDELPVGAALIALAQEMAR